MDELLKIKDLHVEFQSGGRFLPAIDGLSLEVHKHEAVGIVGESGSGKSVTSLAVMRLLPEEGCRVSGEIDFEGRDLLQLPEKEMENVRGNRIAMIFQEPMSSLNPALTVGMRRAGILLALLALPLYVPVLVFGAGAVVADAQGLDASGAILMLGAGLAAAAILAPLAAAAALRIALTGE